MLILYFLACELNTEGVPCMKTGDEVITNFNFDKSDMPFDFIFMASLYFAFHFIGFLGLKMRSK